MATCDIEKSPTGWIDDGMMNERIEHVFPTYLKTDTSIEEFLLKVDALKPKTVDEFNIIKRQLAKQYTFLGKSKLCKTFIKMQYEGRISDHLRNLLTVKAVRSWSGDVNMSVVTKANNEDGKPISCPHDCDYCPSQTVANGATKDMPRSYLDTEPGVARGDKVDFDIVKQFRERTAQHIVNGHVLISRKSNDELTLKVKYDVRVLGGTFNGNEKKGGYPIEYQEEVMCSIYYAANTICQRYSQIRPMKSLEEEIKENETTDCRIIGLSVETRPDHIDAEVLRRFRDYGITIVELGFQHTNNDILNKVHRGHKVEHSIKALRLCKEFGFKVSGHCMPDLPGATPELDLEMLKIMYTDSEFQWDMLKIYICLDAPYTKIREWKKTGKWNPYAEEGTGEELKKVLEYCLEEIPPYIRINRFNRDIPEEHAGNNYMGYISNNIKANIYQMMMSDFEKTNRLCKDIRNREVKNIYINPTNIEWMSRNYVASGCSEHFISLEIPYKKHYTDEKYIGKNKNDLLIGYVRLRIPDPFEDKSYLPNEIKDAALIRELRVLGIQKVVGQKSEKGLPQHAGYGEALMRRAEVIAKLNGHSKVAVIAGVGAKNYYINKLGYEEDGSYVSKNITWFRFFYNIYHLFMMYLYTRFLN
jgi:ELP3 family radical SAM enzyme/protein acetyltransferase